MAGNNTTSKLDSFWTGTPSIFWLAHNSIFNFPLFWLSQLKTNVKDGEVPTIWRPSPSKKTARSFFFLENGILLILHRVVLDKTDKKCLIAFGKYSFEVKQTGNTNRCRLCERHSELLFRILKIFSHPSQDTHFSYYYIVY